MGANYRIVRFANKFTRAYPSKKDVKCDFMHAGIPCQRQNRL